jgi:ribosomal protein S18 acetylase RimI-like enzyme
MGSIADENGVEVRVGGETEFEPARRILKAAYAEYETAFPPANWVRYLEDILDLEGRAEASRLLVAELNGNVVGCVSYFPPGSKASYPSDAFSERWPDDWSAIRLLAVDPQQRGHGVGRRLTVACVARAREGGAPAMGLHTTAPMAIARAMYERMGFERAPQYDFRPSPTVLVEAYRLLL